MDGAGGRIGVDGGLGWANSWLPDLAEKSLRVGSAEGAAQELEDIAECVVVGQREDVNLAGAVRR